MMKEKIIVVYFNSKYIELEPWFALPYGDVNYPFYENIFLDNNVSDQVLGDEILRLLNLDYTKDFDESEYINSGQSNKDYDEKNEIRKTIMGVKTLKALEKNIQRIVIRKSCIAENVYRFYASTRIAVGTYIGDETSLDVYQNDSKSIAQAARKVAFLC